MTGRRAFRARRRELTLAGRNSALGAKENSIVCSRLVFEMRIYWFCFLETLIA